MMALPEPLASWRYGQLNEQQRQSLRKHVTGKHVHDLGAGSGALSLDIVNLGAAKVTAIDKHEIFVEHPRIETVQAFFHELADLRPQVAFLSWPSNYSQPMLLQICRQAEVIIYLGKNTEGTACGSAELFREFLRRKILSYDDDRANTLIALGDPLVVTRSPTPEERAGIEINDSRFWYHEVK